MENIISSGIGKMAPMSAAALSPAVGSVGTVETLYLDLPRPVPLDCGQELHPVRVAYETYGALSPRRDNVIMVCHALSGDAHAAGFSKRRPGRRARATASAPTIAMAPR